MCSRFVQLRSVFYQHFIVLLHHNLFTNKPPPTLQPYPIFPPFTGFAKLRQRLRFRTKYNKLYPTSHHTTTIGGSAVIGVVRQPDWANDQALLTILSTKGHTERSQQVTLGHTLISFPFSSIVEPPQYSQHHHEHNLQLNIRNNININI